MITTKEIKIKIPKEYSSNYFESKFNELGYDVLRWAITDIDNEYCHLNISFKK